MNAWGQMVAAFDKPPKSKRGRGRRPVIHVDEKSCTKCGQVKPLAEFYDRKERPGTYWSHCKKCVTTQRSALFKERQAKEARA